MKDWFFSKDALISAVLCLVLAVFYLFLGIREQHSVDFFLALLALAGGIVNFVRYRKNKGE